MRCLQSGKERFPGLAYVLYFTLALNLPYYLCVRWFAMLPLGWVCAEFALAGILLLFVPRYLAPPVVFLLLCADFLSGVGKTYYIAPLDLIRLAGFLRELPASRFVLALLALCAVLMLCLLAMPLRNRVRSHRTQAYVAIILACSAFAVFLVDLETIVHETGALPSHLYRRPVDVNHAVDYRSLWMGRYPLIRLINNQRNFGSPPISHNTELTSYPAISNAIQIALNDLNTRPGGKDARYNVVLIVVESWGILTDPDLSGRLIQPYRDPEIDRRYLVLTGAVPYSGSTVSGEGRALCGRKLGFSIMDMDEQQLKPCVPNQLHLLGYHTVSAHGMDGAMFNRTRWYKNLGFDDRYFRGDFERLGLPEFQGAFQGTKDTALAGWLQQRLEEPTATPQFYYWMTLSSHLPLPSSVLKQERFRCDGLKDLSDSTAFCGWYGLIAELHQSIHDMALGKLARPTVFVMVGDHAPPFTEPRVLEQIDPNQVPYLILLPRESKSR